jgi:hypothetical protein
MTTSPAGLMNPYFAFHIPETGSVWRFGSQLPNTASPSEKEPAKSNWGGMRTLPSASM